MWTNWVVAGLSSVLRPCCRAIVRAEYDDEIGISVSFRFFFFIFFPLWRKMVVRGWGSGLCRHPCPFLLSHRTYIYIISTVCTCYVYHYSLTLIRWIRHREEEADHHRNGPKVKRWFVSARFIDDLSVILYTRYVNVLFYSLLRKHADTHAPTHRHTHTWYTDRSLFPIFYDYTVYTQWWAIKEKMSCRQIFLPLFFFFWQIFSSSSSWPFVIASARCRGDLRPFGKNNN